MLQINDFLLSVSCGSAARAAARQIDRLFMDTYSRLAAVDSPDEYTGVLLPLGKICNDERFGVSMTDNFLPPALPDEEQKIQPGVSAYRSRPMFINLKSRLHLPGVNELLAACTQHLTASQFKRMLAAWQSMEQFHVYGFVQYGRAIGILAIEEKAAGIGRILTIAIQANQQRRGLGRRMVVESFCSLGLTRLTATSLADMLGFYQRLHFSGEAPHTNERGQQVYALALTRETLFSAYSHEYSAGAVLFCDADSRRLYVLVTELSGNTGLPKGHVEAGESNVQTALREIREETGLTARIVPGFEGDIVYPQGKGMLKHFAYFLAQFDADQELQSGVDVIAHLLPYEQALRKLSFADVRTVLRKADDFLEKKQAPGVLP